MRDLVEAATLTEACVSQMNLINDDLFLNLSAFEATGEKKLRIKRPAAARFFFGRFMCKREGKKTTQLPRCFLQHSIDLHFTWVCKRGRRKKTAKKVINLRSTPRQIENLNQLAGLVMGVRDVLDD